MFNVENSYEGQWVKTAPQQSPTHAVTIRLDRQAYSALKLPQPRQGPNRRTIPPITDTVMDTGAQIVVAPPTLLKALEVSTDSLFPVATSLSTVTTSPVHLLGGLFVAMAATNTGGDITKTMWQLAYISSGVTRLFLSEKACTDLGFIPSDFPRVQTTGGAGDSQAAGDLKAAGRKFAQGAALISLCISNKISG